MPHEIKAIGATLLLSLGCHLTGGIDGGTGRPDADADADGVDEQPWDDAEDEPGAVDGDSGGPASGPATVVASEMRLTTERRCDLDGDGDPDNALADLAGGAELFASTINALVAGAVGMGTRVVYHMPWVDDLASPSDDATTLFLFLGVDADHPDDFSDDFSGHEPFFIAGSFLDACGEPRYYTDNARLEDGRISLESVRLSLPVGGTTIEMPDADTYAVLEPYGASFEGGACGRVDVTLLGGQPSPVGNDLTLLETFLAGGAAFGLTGLPGLSPDVDLDGDGLEQFELDETSRISACIDGDRTVIPGRECWADERIVDGFSLDVEMSGPSAVLAGREPAWEHRVVGDCPEGPPATSIVDGPLPIEGDCARDDEPCDPRLGDEACCDEALVCAGAYLTEYRCTRTCEPLPCRYVTSDREEILGTCRSVPPTFEGDGICEVDSPLADPPPCDERDSYGCVSESGIGICHGEDDPRCMPMCGHGVAGCDSGELCLPRISEPGGACVEPYEPRD